MARKKPPISEKFEEVQQPLPSVLEASQEGLTPVEGVNLEKHANGRPRVIGVPEATTVDPYTGDLTNQGFDYIGRLFRNNPANNQPLACEAPGTRHRGHATSFMKVPGRHTHMPVCGYHLEKYQREARLNPVEEQTAPYETFGGGQNYSHYPIAPESRMEYRIHRATRKKQAEFENEKLAKSLGSDDWTGRKKETHGPGRAPKPKQDVETAQNWWEISGLSEGSSPVNNTEAVVAQAKEQGGKTKVHVAHKALLHALSDGGDNPNPKVYLKKARELGLSEIEAKDLLRPAIEHHKRINKVDTVIKPKVETRSKFAQVAEEMTRLRHEELGQEDLSKYEVASTGSSELAPHYQTLEVKPGASWDEIHDSYRTLAKKYHPDAPGGSHEKMVQLNQAHSALRTARLGSASEVSPINVHEYMADQLGLKTLPKKGKRVTDTAAEEQNVANLMQPGVPTSRSTKRR